MQRCDIAILGAGPYGLSAAAHLKCLPGDLRVFGEPMSFWQCNMPKGMLLRSPKGAACDLIDPENRFTLGAFQKALRCALHRKAPPSITDPFYAAKFEGQVPLEDFIQYGHWFREKAGIQVERRTVTQIDQNGKGFHVRFQDGETVSARRVVVAAGIQPFAYKPPVFEGFSSCLVSHTSEHSDLRKFQGKEVLVIGAGQSALENAVLLYEAGAHVEVFVRERSVWWLGLSRGWMRRRYIAPLLYGKGDVGPAVLSQVIQRPPMYRLLPRYLQNRWGQRAIRPAPTNWVWARAKNIPIHTSCFVVQAETAGERLRVRLNDGTERTVDHVMLGTGYKVDISRYSFLSPSLVEKIKRVDGFPCLGEGLESVSVPGLHFIGVAAMWSYGPLMRFVAGTEFVCRSLQRRIANSEGFAVPECSSEGRRISPTS